jgi:hypothetical protein
MDMVNKMLNTCKGLALACITTMACAQGVVENFRDIAGQPFFPRSYTDVNGTPYLFEDWTPSTITLNSGHALKNVKTNFNLVTSELLFLDENGKTMVASPQVIKSVETEERKFVPTPAKNTFYEVISSEGKATLLKHGRKVIMETKAFNSATVQKNFANDVSYMIVVDGNITEVKSVNDLYKILQPSEPLKEYSKKEKLKQKSPDSWVKIVDYFNSI